MIERWKTLPLPPAGKPKIRCSETTIARLPVCRTLEQSEIRDSKFREPAPVRESKQSQIVDTQKVHCLRLIVTALQLFPFVLSRSLASNNLTTLPLGIFDYVMDIHSL